jgi:alcohol dehydrogenase YqhD (iron-dependent ADH family)
MEIQGWKCKVKTFQFHNPTRIRFGEGLLQELGNEVASIGKRVLLVTGVSHARKSGLLDQVVQILEKSGCDVVLHEGVKPNPVINHVREGIRLARDHKAEIVLALGGGSVLDSAKAVCAGVYHTGDVWDFFIGKAPVTNALPLVTVLTLAATGSEMNGGSVVTNEATSEKYFFSSPLVYPRLSLLIPSLTNTLPPDQTANGLSDAFAHLMEPYFNTVIERPLLQLELKEAIFRTLVDVSQRLESNSQDLEARADFMWSATLALNGVTSAGLGSPAFPVHMIEHSLSALFDVAHGAGLSALFPGWLRWRLEQPDEIGFTARLARFGDKVFDLAQVADLRESARAAIKALEDWYRKIGAPACLAELGLSEADHARAAENAAATAVLWGQQKTYDRDTIMMIFKEAR